MSPIWEKILPLKSIIEPHFGITKPVEGLNKPMGNEFERYRNSAAAEVKTPFIGQTSAKAVGCLYEQSHTRIMHQSK